MPPTRVLVLAAAAFGVVVAVACVAAYLLLRASPEPVNGDLIAYGCKEQKNPWYAICVQAVDGSEMHHVTKDLPTTDPAWSPDGRRIAFTRNEEFGESTTFTADDIFLMDADGSDVREVALNGEGRSLSQPTWSPDGSHVAYVNGESVHTSVSSRYGALVVAREDGSDPRRLTAGPDTDPDWSHNGEIVFVRGENLASPTDANDDIWILDIKTGAARRLTRTPPLIFEAAPAWAPDGSSIAFVRVTQASEYDGTASIHVMNRDGTGERQLLEHKLFEYAPSSLAWSPDGRTIAYETSTTFGCVSISFLDVASGRTRPLTSCTKPIESTFAPVWQPAADPAD